MGRQDQYAVTLTIDGRNCGTWDTLSGGEATSEETKHRPGAMGPQKSYGGPTSVGNVTLGRVMERDRDGELARWMMSRRGKGRCTASRQMLDTDGLPFSKPIVYTGTLLTVTPGDIDSDSSDVDMYEIEISTDGDIG